MSHGVRVRMTDPWRRFHLSPHALPRAYRNLGNLYKQESWSQEGIDAATQRVDNFQTMWLRTVGSLSPTGGKFKKFHFLKEMLRMIRLLGPPCEAGINPVSLLGVSPYHLFPFKLADARVAHTQAKV